MDKSGRTKAVLLSLTEYRKIVRHMHDLEDSLDLKQAISKSRGVISHADLLGQLKNLGIA